MRKLALACMAVSIVATLGCVPKRQNLDLEPLQTTIETSHRHGAVVISVRDEREFTPRASDPTAQTLGSTDHVVEVDRAAAIGQINSASGNFVMDLFLADGATVADVVGDAVAEAFRRAGYAVVTASGSQGEQATRVDVTIERFWAYNTGSWAFKFTFDVVTVLSGAVAPLEGAKTVSSSFVLHSAMGAGKRSYRNLLAKGLEQFIEKLASELEDASNAPSQASELREPGGA